MRTTFTQPVFCAAAALTAATLTDPIVEGLSNSGFFGPGRFTDHSNLDVIPAACVATALALLAVFRWLRVWSAQLAPVSISGLLPKVFLLQIAALYAMETIEQIATAGHPAGSTIWLGGPAPFSLAAHGLACIAVTWLLSRFLTWSARTIVRIVRATLEFLRTILQHPNLRMYRLTIALPNFIEPFIRALAGRAPPFILPATIH